MTVSVLLGALIALPAQAPEHPNPKPWTTGVRIRSHEGSSVGFGSGTIIQSTDRESVVLTCAHLFKTPGQTLVDLPEGSHEAEVIDRDFARDVALVRLRPGRALPASRVVPAHWKPRTLMRMTAVGYSEGQRIRVWETSIANPSMRGLAGQPAYEAIECALTPKQGDSGGGLYTSDGYVAGVCNFADPEGSRGFYAAPGSIYHVLDRNQLGFCYAPIRSGGWGSGSGSGYGNTYAFSGSAPCETGNGFAITIPIRREPSVDALLQAQSVLAARLNRLERILAQLLNEPQDTPALQTAPAPQGVYASPQSVTPQRVPQKTLPWPVPPKASPQAVPPDQTPLPPEVPPEPAPAPAPNSVPAPNPAPQASCYHVDPR